MGTINRRRGTLNNRLWIILLGISLLSVALVVGFTAEKTEVGDIVTVNYALSLEDGTVYYTTAGGQPVQFSLGESKLIPALETALIGMQVGESRTIRLPYEKAYGPYRPELVTVVSRGELPEGSQPIVGQQLQTTREDGTPLTFVITQVTEETVTLDANNPLAGENLTFYVEILKIGKVTASSDLQNQMYLGWILLALGIFVVGFIFLYQRSLGMKRFSMKR